MKVERKNYPMIFFFIYAGFLRDFKYFSYFKASERLENFLEKTSAQGPLLEVKFLPPRLCLATLSGILSVWPIYSLFVKFCKI